MIHCSSKFLLLRFLTPLLQYGIHPKSLKRTYRVVLPKPGKNNCTPISSYRIIVLLQTVLKILERIITYRLTEFARWSGLIHPNQCGSLAGLSTADAAMTLIHEIKAAQEAGLKVSFLFLDIKGRFDNVVHSVLADTLEARNTPPDIVQ